MRRRILYVQYTNPAGYPSLEHSARQLADRDWDVLFFGTVAAHDVMRFRAHPRLSVHYIPFQPGGWRQKLHYLRFGARLVREASRRRPEWIYASDALAAPLALAAARACGARILYHEHDAPAPSNSAWMRGIIAARRACARQAALCIVPNAARAAQFERALGVPAQIVWNCPARDEVPEPTEHSHGDAMWLVYHGSLVPARLPVTILDALARLPAAVKLSVVGYETIGHPGYVQEFLAGAARRGVRERVNMIGAVATRTDLFAKCRGGDVGLALMPLSSADANEQTMAGASNKPFDYLACGLALIVSDLPAWRELYVDNGFGRACDPQDVSGIVNTVHWYLDHPDERRAMGARGRDKILSDWNYAIQFAPVLTLLESAVP